MKLSVDNSLLRTVAQCTTRAAMEHVLGYQGLEESAAMLAGKMAHEAFAHWFETEGEDVTGALGKFAKGYETWAGEHVPSNDRLAFANLRTILGSWFKQNPFRGLPYRVLEIETLVRAPLDDQTMFIGLLDALAQSKEDGSLRIVEHKTTASVSSYWKQRWHVDSQITGYLWAGEQHTKKPILAAYINAVEFSRLPSVENRTCKTHAVPYSECGPSHAKGEVMAVSRTQRQIEEWREISLPRLVKRYRALLKTSPGRDADWSDQRDWIQTLPQEGMFTGACQFCGLKDFCLTGRRGKNFVRFQPWDPEEVGAGR